MSSYTIRLLRSSNFFRFILYLRFQSHVAKIYRPLPQVLSGTRIWHWNPSPSSALSDAEVFVTISDDYSDQRLQIEREITLEAGHHILLKAVLIHGGIGGTPEDKWSELCQIGYSKREKSPKRKFKTKRQNLAISCQWINIDKYVFEFWIWRIRFNFLIISRKWKATYLTKQAPHESDSGLRHCINLKNRNKSSPTDPHPLMMGSQSGSCFHFVSDYQFTR